MEHIVIWFDVSSIILLAIILLSYYTKYNIPVAFNYLTYYLYFISRNLIPVFYIDKETACHRGSLIPILYTIAAYYLIMAIFITIYYRKQIPRHRIFVFCMFSIISFGTVLLQVFKDNFFIECFGITICFLLIYLSIQRPEETFDGDTGLLNKKMFATVLSVKFEEKSPLAIVAISLDASRESYSKCYEAHP